MTKSLGRALKSFRARKDLKVPYVAQKAEITPNYYYTLERGEGEPSISTLAKIAAAIEVPLSEIIRLAEELEKEGE